MDAELEALLKLWREKWDRMSEAERDAHRQAQRRSYVKGELMLEHPDMTEAEAEARVRQAEAHVSSSKSTEA